MHRIGTRCIFKRTAPACQSQGFKKIETSMAEQLLLFPDERPGYHKIFRPWRVNAKTGMIERPRHARVFVIWVKNDNA